MNRIIKFGPRFSRWANAFFRTSLCIALVAALMAVVPDKIKPVFADLSGLPSGTGFACGDSVQGLGGFPYQMGWGYGVNSLFDPTLAGNSGVKDGEAMMQLAIYNTATGEYDVKATYAPSVTGGLRDANDNLLITPSNFKRSNGFQQINGMLMDPLGNVYVAIQPKQSLNQAWFVQLLPLQSQDDPTTSWDDTKLGSMRPIARLQTSNGVGTSKVNAAAYYEDENGNPYGVLAGNFFSASYWNIPLDTTGEPTLIGQSKAGNNKPKDFSWVKEGISYNGTVYDLIGLEQTGKSSGSVHLQQTDGTSYAEIAGVTLPFNSLGSKETFGASYNFKYGDYRTNVYFSANKKGYFVEIGFPDLDNAGNIPISGANSINVEELQGSLETSNNDGAGCPYAPPPTIGDLTASTWPPQCNTDNATGLGSEVPIRVFNQNSGATNVKITATIDGVTVPASKYRSSHSSNTSSYEDLIDAIFPVPGKNGASAGVLELYVEILKDEIWQATVTTTSGSEIVMIPDGGTLDAQSCGDDFIGPDVFDPIVSLGICSVSQNESFEIPSTIDNTGSTSAAIIKVKVDGVLFEEVLVGAGESANIAIGPVTNGSTVELEAIDETSVAASVTETSVASCPVSIDAWDCANQSGFIQSRLNEAGDGYNTVLLDPSANDFVTIWRLKKIATGTGDEAYNNLGGTAMHPTSNKLYGLMRFDNSNGTNGGAAQNYLVRYDDDGVEFVYELNISGGSGVFDSAGNFYFNRHSSNNNANIPQTIWKIDDPDQASGFADRHDPSIPSAGTSIGGALDSHFPGDAFDLAFIQRDLGNGVKDYLLGLGAQGLIVTDLTSASGYAFANIEFADGAPIGSTSYGAAYTVNNVPYFSSNDAGYILSVDLSSLDINDTNQTVKFFNAGNVPNSSSNDGMNCPTSVLAIPEEFGDVFGFVWVDFDDDGIRNSIEDGNEPHVTSYSITFTNANEYKDSTGSTIHQPGGMEFSGVMDGNDSGDYRWRANLPCKDNSGNLIQWTATFDYTNVSNWPSGFTPSGYTTETNDSVTTSELDSDGEGTIGEILVTNPFTVACDAMTHQTDAGVTGDFNFLPTVTVDISCATAVTIDLDNSLSDIDSTYIVNVYRVEAGNSTLQSAESSTQVVAAGATDQYVTNITLPPSDVILYLSIEAHGTLNGVTHPGRYSQDILNQSANDGINFLCVQVQAELDCSNGGEKVTLDNTTSNQDATFIVTPVVDGIDQLPVTQVVAAGATVVLSNANLSIPEDSTWTIKWQATGAIAGNFSETVINSELTKNCSDPAFEPVVTYSFACAADGSVQMTIVVDNTASTQFDLGADPAMDRHAAHVVPLLWQQIYVPGTTIKAPVGEIGQGTINVEQNQAIQIWVQQTQDFNYDPAAENITGGWNTTEFIEADTQSCPSWGPIVNLTFQCGIRGTGLLTTYINNAGSEVEMRYKLESTDFEGSSAIIRDWETVPAGQDRIVTLSQIVDQNLEYSIVVESTEGHPTAFGNGAVTSPAGWGSLTEAEYANCTVENAWSPFAELTAECATGVEEIFLILDNSRSTFGAEFTVDVFNGPSYDSPTNQAASNTQSIPAGGIEIYATTIALPVAGDAISVRVTVIPLTTGGEFLAETSEINLAQVINCPENIVFDISIGLVCGTAVQGLIINNELSSQSITINATQYLSPDSLDGPWKLGEVYSDASSEQTVQIPEGQERQFIFFAIEEYYWKIDWVLTRIDDQPPGDVEIDITTEGTLKSAEKVNSQSEDSCPDSPLFTG